MSSATESVRAQPRIIRGWWIVAVAIIGQSFGIAPMLPYTFGVFAKPLARTPLAIDAFAVLLATFALGRYRQFSSTPGSR
jgi:hypothetical protein